MKNLIDNRYFQELSEATPNDICRNAGCKYNKDTKTYSMIVWGDEFIINPAEKTIKNVSGNFIIHDYFALFIIYYLLNAKETIMQNEWISEKDIPGGATFFRGPHEIPTSWISDKFNNRLSYFKLICEKTGGIELKKADAAFYFLITPRLPISLLFWDGDEDFPPEAKIMYDKSIVAVLSLDIVFALAVAICDRIGKAESEKE